MRLRLFSLIDEVLALYESKSAQYYEATNNISAQMYKVFRGRGEYVANVTARVKSPASMREKIIRNRIYQRCDTAQMVLDDMTDIIGIMLECRFVKDEAQLYEILKQVFIIKEEDGFYSNPAIEGITLDMDSPQPQMQKNGFPIYRVDGKYCADGKTMRFELQIKAIVNMFWGEIEHKIIYKNSRYMLMDSFLRELLASVHENLICIDKQLMLIYEQASNAKENKNTEAKNNFQSFVAKTLNDIFQLKIVDSIGFSVNFKQTCDILSQFIYKINLKRDENHIERLLYELIDRFKAVSTSNIDFEQTIELGESFDFDDDFCETVAVAVSKAANKDFEWNLFLKMLFAIEPGDDTEDYRVLIRVIKAAYEPETMFIPLYNMFDSTKSAQIKDEILLTLAKVLANYCKIDIIYREKVDAVCNITLQTVTDIAYHAEPELYWEEEKANILFTFYESVKRVFE